MRGTLIRCGIKDDKHAVNEDTMVNFQFLTELLLMATIKPRNLETYFNISLIVVLSN